MVSHRVGHDLVKEQQQLGGARVDAHPSVIRCVASHTSISARRAELEEEVIGT